MKIETKFDIGQIVFLVTDLEQLPRMVTGIDVRHAGVNYQLTQGSNHSYHYEMEMRDTEDINLLLGIKQENHEDRL